MNKAREGVQFSTEVLEGFLRTMYDGFDTSSDIEPSAWREALRVINKGTVEGLEASGYPVHEKAFLEELRHSNEVFSAFKVHKMSNQMAERMYRPDGSLKPFDEWVRDVRSISSHYVGSWLETEYDTAIIRAHQAADWQEFMRNKDVMPNLRWMPTTSPVPDSGHRVFWEKGVCLPVDDPFWSYHRPGDRWNCKCSLQATDDPVVPLDAPVNDPESKPQRGLDTSPQKGHIFSDNHPYFPDSCASCVFYKAGNEDGIKNWFKWAFQNRRKDCHQCPYINVRIDKAKGITPPEVENYRSENGGLVMISPYQSGHEYMENKRIAHILAVRLNQTVYMLPELKPDNKEEKKLRVRLIPQGVKENKNPDYMIGGKFFDVKSMVVGEKNDTDKKHLDLTEQKKAIENRIKKAKMQADNIIIEVPEYFSHNRFETTVKNYLDRSHTSRIVIIIQGDRVYQYEN